MNRIHRHCPRCFLNSVRRIRDLLALVEVGHETWTWTWEGREMYARLSSLNTVSEVIDGILPWVLVNVVAPSGVRFSCRAEVLWVQPIAHYEELLLNIYCCSAITTILLSYLVYSVYQNEYQYLEGTVVRKSRSIDVVNIFVNQIRQYW